MAAPSTFLLLASPLLRKLFAFVPSTTSGFDLVTSIFQYPPVEKFLEIIFDSLGITLARRIERYR